MDTSITRRNFLKTTTAASALAFPAVLRAQAPGTPTPNNRVNVAVIGANGRGGAAVEGVHNENVVALCDVDAERGREAVKKLKGRFPEEAASVEGAEHFQDYRKMFDKLGNKIDAVTISTPDHMHFPIAMTAMSLGKHVYVEKPLAHTVWETREMTRLAKEKKVITQMGNQGHTHDGTRLLKEWVEAGVLGEVREVVSWTNRPFYPPWREPVGSFKLPDHSKFMPVMPKSLNWDAWLGVAKEREYDPCYMPWKWRGWWDFGTGPFGDVACHIMDGAYWALNLGAPTSVEAMSTQATDVACPLASIVTSHFPARGSMPPVKYTWSDGSLMPPFPVDLELDRSLPDEAGTLLFGSKCTVLCSFYYETVRIIPEAKMRQMAPSLPAKTIPRVQGGPFAEWLRGIKGGPKPGSNFEYSGPFSETVLLSNVAIRSRRRIEWDSKAMRVTNLESANKFVKKDYRPGWF
ncbi:MAG: Gfo/Idh/MocA family oxidoreductase [Verrucomicrobia bacterium]|nr:Gfo/Idh/MocA family oxidoreductase [Verrucomicrobiota bacterium]